MPGFMDMVRGGMGTGIRDRLAGGGFTGGGMGTGFIPPNIGGGAMGVAPAPSVGAAPRMNRKPGMGAMNSTLPPNRRRGGTQGAVRPGQTQMARKMRGRGGMSMF